MINWIKKNIGPEARFRRLEDEVARKTREAEIAAAELPLLLEKDKALEVIKKRNDMKRKIRQKQLERLNPDKPKTSSNFPKLSEKKPMYNVKTPTDRVFGN